MNQEKFRTERSLRNYSRFCGSSWVVSAWQHLFAGAVVVLALALSTSAQNSTGRLIGTVTDPQGAAIAEAKVTVTNTGTNVSRTTTTDNTGAYQVLDLPIGMYSVTLQVQGFSKIVTNTQELTINQSLRIDLHPRVGSSSEVVNVESEAAQVETLNPTVGGTVTGKVIQDLPLNGRETLDLALTQPGVVPAPSTGYGSEKNGEFDQGFTVAGGRPDSVTYLLDGGLNNSVTGANVVFDPNPDAVAEFRILTNNYTAEYGRSGGGTVSVQTKSGTNVVHGSLFEYLRNDAFNANDFFDNANGNPRPVLKRNQFGGTIGGPITIPHVVNGKERFFFFFAYEGQRQASILNDGKVTVYTPAELNGDFSQPSVPGQPDHHVGCFLVGTQPSGPFSDCTQLDANGNPVPVPAHPYFQSNPSLAAQSIIDPTKLDPVAKAYINAGLIPNSPSGSILSEGHATNNFDQYTGKVDLFATQNDHFSVTIGSQKSFQQSGLSDTNIPGYPQNDFFTELNGNFSYLKLFSPQLVNEAHATASRFYHHAATVGTPSKPRDLGVIINSDFPTGPSLLQFASGLRLGFNPNTPRTKADNVYGVSDSLTWIKGEHTWKFGGRLSFMQESSKYITDGNGLFDFGTYGGVSGNDLADFLFGAPDLFFQFAQAHNNQHQKQLSGFAQDEWKVTRRFVLTLGLRYEYTSPETDTKGYSYSVIPEATTNHFVDAPPGLVVPGDKGAPRGWYFPDFRNFAPRFGFAWDPFGNGATSIRGGAGMFYDTLNGWISDWNAGGPPWFAGSVLGFPPPNTNSVSTILSDPYGAAGATDPYPSAPTAPGGSLVAQGATFPYGTALAFVDPHLKTPYIYQYNLSVQRQLRRGLMTEVGYVGSSSHKLLTFVDNNPINPLTGNRILTDRLGLTPGVNDYASQTTFAGRVNANYNGLLASVIKSPGQVAHLGDMFFTLSYTWSHNLDNGSGFNQRSGQVPYYNPHQFYSNSDFDVRQRLVLSGGWELPFATMWDNGPKRLTQGWSLYPIAFYQSGIPIDIYLQPSYLTPAGPVPASSPGSSGYGDPELERPDQLTPVVETFDPRRVQAINGVSGNYYFNPAGFAVDPCIAAGNCPRGFYGTFQRNSLRGPSRVNFNLALEKATNLPGEHLKMLFRVEAFNILNHAQFVNPGSTSQFNFYAATVGQVTQTFDPRILQLSLRFSF
jgi:hypothetical protein